MNIETQYCLQNHHTFGCPIKARLFATLNQASDFEWISQHPLYPAENILILGGGSNILFKEDFPSLIIHNRIKNISQIKKNSKHIWISVGAGENWHDFVCYCVKNKFYGIENLSLIPGTVGAAPVQNIGAYGVELQDIFDHLTAIDLHTGQTHHFDSQQCQFGYRNSIFKNQFKNRFCITQVTFKLSLTPSLTYHYPALKQHMSTYNIQPTLSNIHQAIIQIRSSKLPCPSHLPNAGSFFKNPFIHHDQFTQLQQQFPSMPHYFTTDKQVKIPAAWLIEQCEFKGKRFGRVGVHAHHALVLVNYQQGNGHELHHLAQHIVRTVHQKFGIVLENEVNII